MKTPPTIAMLSDFGYRDAYVGIMKSVISNICPDASIIDLCHEAPAQNVLSGAFLLATAMPFVREGATIVAVVDPGVGTARRAVVVETQKCTLVGPDNGLFTMAFERSKPLRAYALENRKYQLEEVSKTFHGRDIFSPAGAHVACGVPLEDFGPEVDLADLVRLREIGPMIKDRSVECRVVHIDHFGNIITNLTRSALRDLSRRPTYIRHEGEDAPFADTFGEVPEGNPVCYFNSSGYLELGVRNRDAAEYFDLEQRDALHVVTEALD